MDTLFRKTHSTDRKQSVPDSNAYLCVAQELCKDNANREQRHQTCLNGYAEMPLVFYKDNANREQRHQTCLKGYAKMPLIFCKDNANRKQ